MRISDWSSDVCSSDLRPGTLADPGLHVERAVGIQLHRRRDLFVQDGRWIPRRRHALAPADVVDPVANPAHDSYNLARLAPHPEQPFSATRPLHLRTTSSAAADQAAVEATPEDHTA